MFRTLFASCIGFLLVADQRHAAGNIRFWNSNLGQLDTPIFHHAKQMMCIDLGDFILERNVAINLVETAIIQRGDDKIIPRRKWLHHRMVKEPDEVLDQTTAAGPPIPEHITDEEVLAALNDVQQDYRAVVLLVDVEEFSYKDAAGILGVPIGTVMSRLSRGRRLLRERLAGIAQSFGIGRAKGEGKTA